MDIEMTGFVHAKAKVRNLSELRQLVRWCDKHHVDGDVEVDWGVGYVYLALTGDHAVEAEWIECGNHIHPERRYDLLVGTHVCDYYDEDRACGLCGETPARGYASIETDGSRVWLCHDDSRTCYQDYQQTGIKEPARYDWPTKDRLKSQSEQLRTHDAWRYNDLSRPE